MSQKEHRWVLTSGITGHIVISTFGSTIGILPPPRILEPGAYRLTFNVDTDIEVFIGYGGSCWTKSDFQAYIGKFDGAAIGDETFQPIIYLYGDKGEYIDITALHNGSALAAFSVMVERLNAFDSGGL